MLVQPHAEFPQSEIAESPGPGSSERVPSAPAAAGASGGRSFKLPLPGGGWATVVLPPELFGAGPAALAGAAGDAVSAALSRLLTLPGLSASQSSIWQLSSALGRPVPSGESAGVPADRPEPAASSSTAARPAVQKPPAEKPPVREPPTARPPAGHEAVAHPPSRDGPGPRVPVHPGRHPRSDLALGAPTAPTAPAAVPVAPLPRPDPGPYTPGRDLADPPQRRPGLGQGRDLLPLGIGLALIGAGAALVGVRLRRNW